jgi:predicted dehydrogenase
LQCRTVPKRSFTSPDESLFALMDLLIHHLDSLQGFVNMDYYDE